MKSLLSTSLFLYTCSIIGCQKVDPKESYFPLTSDMQICLQDQKGNRFLVLTDSTEQIADKLLYRVLYLQHRYNSNKMDTISIKKLFVDSIGDVFEFYQVPTYLRNIQVFHDSLQKRYIFSEDIGTKRVLRSSSDPSSIQAIVCESKSDTIKIGSQTYINCYRFLVQEAGGSDADHFEWFAKGIGLIRIESTYWDGAFELCQ